MKVADTRRPTVLYETGKISYDSLLHAESRRGGMDLVEPTDKRALRLPGQRGLRGIAVWQGRREAIKRLQVLVCGMPIADYAKIAGLFAVYGEEATG